MAAGSANRTPVGGHRDLVSAVAFSPEGSTLAGGGGDGAVRLWDAHTGALHREFTRPVRAVAFSPDGSTLAIGGDDGVVRLWDPRSGALLVEFTARTGRVLSVAFSPDGSTLAVGGDDGVVRLWGAHTGALLLRSTARTGQVLSVAFSPDGSTLAACGDGVVRLLDTTRSERWMVELARLTAHTGPVRAVAFSPDGSTLAAGGDDGAVRLWDPRTGALHREFTARTGPVLSVAFSPDGSTLAAGGDDGAVRLWDPRTGALHSEFTARTGPVLSVAFNPDGSTLAAGGDDGAVRLWDPRTGALHSQFTARTGQVLSVAFNADGPILARGGEAVQLPDAPTGERRAQLTGHTPVSVWRPRRAPYTAHALALTYVVLAGGLIVLRAFDLDFSFLGVGWILAFALVPLLPWLLPLIAPWFGRMAPYVQNVRIGSVLEVRLRDAEPRVASLGQISSVLSVRPLETTGAGQFTSTDALEIIDSMNELHNNRAELVIVELEGGAKWRYPNLYFLARLLEADPGVRQMIFTEARAGEGGFFVCMCSPSELRKRLEAAVPAYAESGQHLSIPADMTAPGLHDALKQQFDAFRQALTATRAQFSEAEGWVRSAELVKLLGTVCNRVSIEAKEPLTDDDYRTILLSPFRYVATIADGRFNSVIDQVPLATAFARAVLSVQR